MKNKKIRLEIKSDDATYITTVENQSPREFFETLVNNSSALSADEKKVALENLANLNVDWTELSELLDDGSRSSIIPS